MRGIAELLRIEGFVAHSAFNGTEGIASVRSLRPDALLLDLRMPDMDGSRSLPCSATPLLKPLGELDHGR
ncbi:response regulator [Terriglobus sp. TAA 43]|uniref:response regulator n=1 Tax=Terriglobus sp. TAA 43 TaxID=278961 RepID=UPI0009FCEBD1